MGLFCGYPVASIRRRTLIGANGAGKTTTLRTISGLTIVRGVHGEIYFDDKPIHRQSGHKIVSLGLMQVLEGRHIFSKLTVEENLMTGAYLRKDTKNVKSDLDHVYKLFPRLLERRTQMGARSPAENNRCWQSAAH